MASRNKFIEAALKHLPREARIGKGGYGFVWRACSQDTQKVVAVKCMQCSRTFKSTAWRELEVVDVIHKEPHPFLVEVHGYEVFPDDGLCALFMELCPGGDLYGRIRFMSSEGYYSSTAAEWDDVLRAPMLWIGQVFLGLEHLNLNIGVMLRDLKTKNLVLDAGFEVVKIIDFGFAKAAKESAGMTFGAPPGTPGYVAPELLEGRRHSSHTVDLYSFGAVSYEILSGKAPLHHPDARANFKTAVNDWNTLRDLIQGCALLDHDAKGMLLNLIVTQDRRIDHVATRAHNFMRRLKLPMRLMGVAGASAWLSDTLSQHRS